MRGEPRRDDQTICTAIAPDAVFTVRTFRPDAEQNPRSATRNQGNIENVSQVKVIRRTVLSELLLTAARWCHTQS
jgi:hypothetical protein